MNGFHVFVYGTLRSGEEANTRLADCVKVAHGTVRGTLYEIDGRFPALIHYGSDTVRGEIWHCQADLLPVLDAYEGIASGLFQRIGLEVETDTGAVLPCWVYTAGPRLSRHLTPEHRIA